MQGHISNSRGNVLQYRLHAGLSVRTQKALHVGVAFTTWTTCPLVILKLAKKTHPYIIVVILVVWMLSCLTQSRKL